VLLAGGGTGGHIAPALATAEALRAERPDLTVEFVGTARGMEARMVPAEGWTLHTVEALPLRRISPALLRVPFVLGRAALTVRALMRERGVVAACVFGGYTSGPLALAARLAGVPLVVHEQNAVPGLANRIASRWASAVALSVPGTGARFAHPERTTVTGNPVRAEIARADLAALRAEAVDAFGLDPARRTLLVVGGSQGADRLNDAVLASAGRWPDPAGLQVLHVAGRGKHERVAAAWAETAAGALEVRCLPFVRRMDLAYALADVALCRSGASTVAELCVAGVPAVLVPYPHAAADEQTANARALADAGAAVLVRDADLDAAELVGRVAPLLAEPRRLETMAAAARALGRRDAAGALARLLLDVAGDRVPPAGGAVRDDTGS
jgi:UDP-N-acetylglucosamine--N-acetylmuramyl-(pentapeptide) pyrophosphoryl-undecaprenol N-acetylglucosamine transferase